jgi:hypothetical protein
MDEACPDERTLGGNEMKTKMNQDDLAEMESAAERLREEIRRLQEERNALEQGNLELYRRLTEPEF